MTSYIKINRQISAEQTKHDLAHNVNVVMGCALLMLVLVYLDDGILAALEFFSYSIADIISAFRDIPHEEALATYNSFIQSELFLSCLSVFTQILMIVIPASVAMVTIRNRPVSFYPLKAVLPDKPWSFIGLSFGLCYTVNLVCSLLLSRFYPDFNPYSIVGTVSSFASVVLIAPLLEEWIFRGIFFQSLLPYSRNFAVLLSAVIFGLMHRNPPSVINAFVFGMLAAIGFEKTGSILICLVLHMSNNAIAYMATSLISDSSTVVFAVFLGLFCIMSVILAVGLIINIVVSRKRSVLSPSCCLSSVPRIEPSFYVKTLVKCPYTWLFLFLFIYSVFLLYI